ncbi:GNAT family N-acetyltransferase [Litchfieldia salsa]|uniref:Acetyltransferase (GNAT) domain-containing protein n=1 Tax=Litchfieldia salsa TaxID=930152 RepID=A0A1H0SVF9_9BACI|nr:GNAT family N-acetyltransferase [Litchfieldia salsa]SDP45782.1 Acetyltransferase (GNAT) domain-containing protein [Litchfieldia salsa]
MDWYKQSFMVSDDSKLIDLESVLHLLLTTYWASNRTKEMIEKSIKNSVSFGLYDHDKQIGFARVVSDKAVFSWVLDVVVDESYRGKGLGQWLIGCILEHPDLKHTSFALATKDAHDFYKKFDFIEDTCMRKRLTI